MCCNDNWLLVGVERTSGCVLSLVGMYCSLECKDRGRGGRRGGRMVSVVESVSRNVEGFGFLVSE